jgi:hypothetical protein
LTLDSRQGFAYASTTKPKPLQVENYKYSVVCVNSISRWLFIGVPGAITDLFKLVTCQALAARPSHVADRPWSTTSTNSRPRVLFYHLLESVTTKETHGRLQSGAGRPPIGSTRQWTLHTASLWPVHCQGDTYFDRIPHFLVIS